VVRIFFFFYLQSHYNNDNHNNKIQKKGETKENKKEEKKFSADLQDLRYKINYATYNTTENDLFTQHYGH